MGIQDGSDVEAKTFIVDVVPNKDHKQEGTGSIHLAEGNRADLDNIATTTMCCRDLATS